MILRLLTPDDAENFWHLRLEMLRNDPASFVDSAEEHLKTTVETARERLSKNDPARNFVVGIFEDGKLTATAGFFRRPHNKENHKGHIWGVYVTRTSRERGIGSTLMKEIIRRARTLDAWSRSRWWLPQTFPHNACIKLSDLKAMESSRARSKSAMNMWMTS